MEDYFSKFYVIIVQGPFVRSRDCRQTISILARVTIVTLLQSRLSYKSAKKALGTYPRERRRTRFFAAAPARRDRVPGAVQLIGNYRGAIVPGGHSHSFPRYLCSGRVGPRSFPTVSVPIRSPDRSHRAHWLPISSGFSPSRTVVVGADVAVTRGRKWSNYKEIMGVVRVRWGSIETSERILSPCARRTRGDHSIQRPPE